MRAANPVCWLLVGLLVALAGCAANRAYLSPAVSDLTARSLPKKILLMSPNIRVIEVSTGGVAEQVKDWSNQAKENIVSALRQRAGPGGMFEIVDMPEVTEAEKAILDQHVAMYEAVAAAATEFGVSTDSVWKARSKSLRYTLGPGLAFLAEKSGADGALFLQADDAISTGGRRAVLILTLLMFGLPALPPGYSYLSAGVVDLRSGDLLWLDYDWNIAKRDIRRAADAAGLMDDVFKSYPANRPRIGVAQ